MHIAAFLRQSSFIGAHVANTGVGPYHPGEEIEIKKYYQWVPFMLFLQGIMFYVPHIFYKYFEKGKIESILEGLHRWILSNEERQSKEKELAEYIVGTKGTHRSWCLKLLFASGLYVVNVVGQIFFTDCFLGYEFSTYGVNAASFLEAKVNQKGNRINLFILHSLFFFSLKIELIPCPVFFHV